MPVRVEADVLADTPLEAPTRKMPPLLSQRGQFLFRAGESDRTLRPKDVSKGAKPSPVRGSAGEAALRFSAKPKEAPPKRRSP